MKKLEVINHLENQLNEKKLFHSILFFGNEVEDLNELVFDFSYKLIGYDYKLSNPEKEFSESEFQINEIISQAKRNLIQDYKYIDAREAKVKDIRELFENIQEKPFLLNRKIFIIENFEFLNINSQNALLKILEEPPSFVNILLTARSLNNILDTIKSRCEKIYISESGEGTLDKELEDFFEPFVDFFYDAETLKKVMFYYKYNDLILKNKEKFKRLLEYLELKLEEDYFKNSKYIEVLVETRRKINGNNNFEITKDKLLFSIWEKANNKEKR